MVWKLESVGGDVGGGSEESVGGGGMLKGCLSYP